MHDASLGWLITTWGQVVADMETISEHMPQDVAECIAADFEQISDELEHRVHLTRRAGEHCLGHDGAMMHLASPTSPPPDL